MYEIFAKKLRKDAVIQCVKLLNQKNPENVVEEEDGLYSHTNSRGKKRMFLPCNNYKEYKEALKKYPSANLHRCITYWVLYWVV